VYTQNAVTQVPQRDVFDFLNEYVLHRRVEPEIGGTLPTGLEWAILPTFSYNPVYGFAVGAMTSGAGRLGAASSRYSQLAVSGNISTTGQIQAQARGEVFDPSDDYLLKADFRYLDTKRSTWGLGPLAPDQEEYPMEFTLVRTYATLYRRASGPVYIGLGYHYDEFNDIIDSRAQEGEATPFTDYSGGALTSTVASGLSVNVLAFWLYGWLTFGETPYLNLPSSGWDTYGRGARGYLQGRIRGADQVYFESEYGRVLTRDGLWGAVTFLNGTSTSLPESGVLGRMDYGGGVGLRIKFNKHTDTNLTIDYGWGKSGSRGFFLGMSEVF